MYIKDEVMTLVSVTHRSGISKAGSNYDFYLATLADDRFNRFDAMVTDGLKTFDGKLVPLLQSFLEGKESVEPLPVVVNLILSPRGMGLTLSLLTVEEESK